MEGSHQANLNSIICRKGTVLRTEIERPFLAAKNFNTNFVNFLPPYHGIISNVQGRAPITVLRARNLVYEKL